VPSLSSQTTVSIRLIDVDNLNPAFRSSSYNLNISIDTPASSVVIPNEGSVNAYDQDIGINATILYSMTANTYLIISKTTGTITLQRNFSFPTRFDLLLKAEQEDNANRSVTTILYVNVYEINLYPPRFVNSPYSLIGYTINSREQTPSFNGTVTDSDIVRRITFSVP
ncbi:unnamed protein product, partial [Didymodactylos carnosus]